MKKVQTTNKTKGLFGFLTTLALAIGVGVSLAPREIVKTEAAVPTGNLITAPADIVSGSSYHLVRHDGQYYVETSKTGSKLDGTSVTGTTIEGVGFLFVKSGSFWSIKNNETGKYLIQSTNGASGTNVAYVDNVGSHWDISTASGLKFAAVNNNSAQGRGMLWQKTQIGGYSLSNQTATDYFRIALLEVQATDPSVSITGGNKSVAVGQTISLTKTVANAVEANATFEWVSSNTSVATIANNGTLSALSQGTTSVTVKMNYEGTEYVSGPVVVSVIVPVEGVTLNETSVNLTAGGSTLQLTASVSPSNADDKTGVWSSDDATVATVSGTGLVTPVKQGNTVIRFTTNDGSKTASATVTVAFASVVSVSLNKQTADLKVGGSETIIANVNPSQASQAVTWETSDDKVVTVNDGLISGLKAGSAVITATSVQDPTKSKSLEVTVTVGPISLLESAFGSGGQNDWTVKSGKFESYFGHNYGSKGALTLESITLDALPAGSTYKIKVIATGVASPGNKTTISGLDASGNAISGVSVEGYLYGSASYSGNLTNARNGANNNPLELTLPTSNTALSKIKIVFAGSPNFLVFGINVEATPAIDTSYDDALEFANFIMGFDGGDAEGMSDSFATCEDNLFDAMIEWDGLSVDAKDLFKTHADFEEARQRLFNWLLANGFDSFDDLDVNGSGGLISKNKDSNALTATIIVGVIGLTTLTGYYFLKKKKQA